MRAAGASHNLVLLPDPALPERVADIVGGTQGTSGVEVSRKDADEFCAPDEKTRPSAPEVFLLPSSAGGKRHLATVSRIREQRFPLFCLIPVRRIHLGVLRGEGELRGCFQPGRRELLPAFSGELVGS